MAKKRKRIRINKKLQKEKRLGQIGINKQGLEMEIIKYRNASDIDIKFLIDGYVAKNKRYDKFLLGTVNNPNFPFAQIVDRTGERRQNTDGYWMEIVEYFNAKNCTVKFDDDGSIVEGVYYFEFKNGRITHPIRFTESLLYLYPKIAESIAIPENNITLDDCAKINPGSGKKYFVKCFDCNKVSSKKKMIRNLTRYNNISCEYCSDNISIPNKILRQISEQLNLNWIFEYNEDWMGNHRFDAYDVDLKQPIEMDCFYYNNHKGKRKEVDNWKDEEAINHDMKLPIRIDLMDEKEYDNNKFNYIKQQTYLVLNSLYDLDKIDWNKAFIESQKSLMIEACRLWQEEKIYSVLEICNILNLGRNTVIRYLKRGNELGICDYSREKAYEERGKRTSGINNIFSNLYWVIKPNGEYYSDRPLCEKEILNSHSNGLLNIGRNTFNKYIKPYEYIDIIKIKQLKPSKQTVEKLTPFDGWRIILLSKEEKEEYFNNIN